MNPAPPIAPAGEPMSDTVFALALALLLLCPLVIAGIVLINAGLGRSRSAAQALLGNLALIAVTAIVFLFVGATFAGTLGNAGVVWHAAGKTWSLLGLGPFLLRGLAGATRHTQLALMFEFLAVAMLAQLPWGSGADRWRLAGGFVAAALLAGIVFPTAAHWVWNGGWLAQLGTNFSLGGGFLDAGGAGAVHMIGGMSALALVWITGSRRGKFPKEGLSTAMPGHNASYVLFGCMIVLVGWLAWNCAGALVWLHADLSSLPGIAIATLLSASGALAATFSVTRFRFGKPDASLCANGWLAGLVASSACSAVVSPAASLFIGGVAGVFTPLLVELFELALSTDDPSGAITVHGAAGLWGLLAAGIFSPVQGQFVAQLVGIAALLGVMLPLIYLLFSIANRVIPFRVDPDGERMGMDLHELGGGAYPEFVIHRDESYR
jgi:ammonium transporter, Amt family